MLHLLVLDKLSEGSLHTVLGSPGQDPLLLWNNNANNIVAKGVSVDECRSDGLRKSHDTFNFLGGDVLSLRKFEDVLASINDLDRAIRIDLANISCLEPALLIKSLRCLILTLVVS